MHTLDWVCFQTLQDRSDPLWPKPFLLRTKDTLLREAAHAVQDRLRAVGVSRGLWHFNM